MEHSAAVSSTAPAQPMRSHSTNKHKRLFLFFFFTCTCDEKLHIRSPETIRCVGCLVTSTPPHLLARSLPRNSARKTHNRYHTIYFRRRTLDYLIPKAHTKQSLIDSGQIFCECVVNFRSMCIVRGCCCCSAVLPIYLLRRSCSAALVGAASSEIC